MNSRNSVSVATITTQFLQRPGLSPATVKSYESTLLPFLAEYGSFAIEILTRQTVSEYLNGLTQISYTTHHRHQSVIQALFNFAVEQGCISHNPIARLKRRKPDASKGEHSTDTIIRYLTPDQLVVLYEVVQSDLRMNAIVHLLHRTGARIAEILALDLKNVNLAQQKFQVIGKGNRQRWCYYSEDAAQALADYFKYERYSHTALFTAQQPFTKEVSRLHYRTVHDRWTELIAPASELADIRMHDLRHTFATERVGLISLEELRALMGHQKIETTLRYQKVTSQRAEIAAKRAFNSLKNAEL